MNRLHNWICIAHDLSEEKCLHREYHVLSIMTNIWINNNNNNNKN